MCGMRFLRFLIDNIVLNMATQLFGYRNIRRLNMHLNEGNDEIAFYFK